MTSSHGPREHKKKFVRRLKASATASGPASPLTATTLQPVDEQLWSKPNSDENASGRGSPVSSGEKDRMGWPSRLDEPSLAALYALDSIKGFGPLKFRDLFERGVAPETVLHDPAALPIAGKRGDTFRTALREIAVRQSDEFRTRARRQLDTADQHGGLIITYSHPAYPDNVYLSNNPIPILYVRGAVEVLQTPEAIAAVGSRRIRSPYSEAQARVVAIAAETGWTVTSGFALGADTIAHRAAVAHGGRTLCVMPGGLDRPFPPENKDLWDDFLSSGSAAFLSEFAFGTRAASLTLRKRNKLIVAAARAVLVGQSAESGGAMNAYRFALEQKKPVATFAPDDRPDTSGNGLIGRQLSAASPLSRVFRPDSKPEVVREWLRQLRSST